MKKAFVLIYLWQICVTSYSQQTGYQFVLDTKKIGASIQPTMYGLFFEDINFGADGGLYAELVKNRSFDFPQPLMGWNTSGNVKLKNDLPLFVNNPNYLVLSKADHPHKRTVVENEGFRGMGFKQDSSYRFSIWAKTIHSVESQKILIELIDSQNNGIGKQELTIVSPEWTKISVTITSTATEAKGKLRIFFIGNGSIVMEHVSLFPTNTWKRREKRIEGRFGAGFGSPPSKGVSFSRWMHRRGD